MLRTRLPIIVAVVLLVPIVLVGALVLVAQSEWAERRVERMVGARLDREVQIEGISLRWGWPPGIVFARLRIGNPPWAKTPSLVDAEGLYARVHVLPLFKGMFVIPYLGARKANAGLEMDGDRATWRFGKESNEPGKLVLMRVFLDDGHIAYIDAGENTDLNLKLAGATFRDLGKVTGIVLPDTPPYRLAGQLKHSGNEWHFSEFKGRVGDSDLAGNVIYTKRKPRALFQARLRSGVLDLDDLGPLIGAPPKTGPGETAAAHQVAKSAQRKVSDRILPDTEFSTRLWGRMDADVRLEAKRVKRPKQLPLDALQAHLVLGDSVLRLQPLNFTMAGGRVTSDITLDPKHKPMRGVMKVDVQGLQLKQLFPTLESMKDALGTLYGRADIVGHGQSVAALLGSSDGSASFAVSGGRVSALLVELLGLDVAESVMLLGRKHEQVELRCAASGLEVQDGVAKASDFVVDTSDTLIKVEGAIDLRNERLDLETKPYPKDMSPLALRTPLYIKGPFKDPGVRPKAGPLVARVAVGAALGAIAPPLAALALVETGPGKDTDCGRLLAEARSKGAVKKAG